MGEVYLAEDTKLGRTVAVKIFPSEGADDDERRRRFVREAKAASAIDHPNVAHVYEIGEAEGLLFIAMQYVAGDTLADRSKSRPLGTEDYVSELKWPTLSTRRTPKVSFIETSSRRIWC